MTVRCFRSSRSCVPAPDPVRCCEQLAGLPYRLFLDSAARGTRLGRYSFLTADPVAVVRSKGAHRAARSGDGDRADVAGDALDAIRALLAPHAADPVPGLPPFQGGAAGYLAYDWGRVLERLPAPRYDDLALPDVVLGIYDWVLAWDHDAVASLADLDRVAGDVAAGAIRRARRARAPPCGERLRDGTRRRTACHGAGAIAPAAGSARPVAARAPSYPVEGGWWDPRLELRSSFTHAGYLDAVPRVREYILAGDIFQANLSQRFEAPLGEPPWALYRRLRTRNAAPFAAFLDFPGARGPQRVARAVPARRRRGPRRDAADQGHAPARRRPGARRRARAGADRERQGPGREPDDRRPDAQRPVARLRAGQRARPRAVRARALRHGPPSRLDRGRRARAGCDALDLLRAAFPGGSITGAPKVRAMEIIAELEPSAARRLLRRRSATGASPARSTPASPSARRSPAAAAYTSAPAAASSPTPIPSRSTARRSTRRAGMIDALLAR